MDLGLLQFYVGDGKGKTTAAVGQIVRAHGAGLKCAMYQFLHAKPASEAGALSALGVPVECAQTPDARCIEKMTPGEKGSFFMGQRALYTKAVRAIRSGEYDVVALDGILDLLQMGGLDLDALRMALTSRPEGVEVLLTGRQMPRKLFEIADYVTSMRAVKHPGTDGQTARLGIEY
ncbi:MAG: cob(I)yrinic acid a,c-diamide adenosyltransferase [Candidatus Spyradocola sp.]|jgi:cob(I)alamin adenosyltransferase